MARSSKDARQLAEEIEQQVKKCIYNSDINRLPLEASPEKRIEKFLEKIGGPVNLVEGSAAQRLYNAVTYWETGLLLARRGFGIDAFNLLFRGLLTEKRAAIHRMYGTNDPNNPDGSHKWMANALETIKREMQQAKPKITPAQIEFMEKSVELKLMTLRAHFSETTNRKNESLMEIEQAIQIVMRLRNKYTLETLPASPPKMLLWLPDESVLSNETLVGLIYLKSVVFSNLAASSRTPTERDAYKQQALKCADTILSLCPNSGTGIMCKAANLWRTKNDAEKKEAMRYYKLAAEVLPSDDIEKAIASYMYASGLITGAEACSMQVGMLRGLHDRAAELEDTAYAIFGEAKCEGKFLCEQMRAELDKFRDEDCLAGPVQMVSYSTEEEKKAKLSKLEVPKDHVAVTAGDFSREEFDSSDRVAHPCVTCGKSFSTLLRCENCKKPRYCSEACNKADVEHRQTCTTI